MPEFDTIGINNTVFSFDYEVVREFNEATFYVYSIPRDQHRFLQYTFSILNDNVAKGEMVTANGFIEFRRKGIPEKIIEIAGEVLNKDIISSPRTFKPGNFLIDSSVKAWERLIVGNPNAERDLANDCYILRRRNP